MASQVRVPARRLAGRLPACLPDSVLQALLVVCTACSPEGWVTPGFQFTHVDWALHLFPLPCLPGCSSCGAHAAAVPVLPDPGQPQVPHLVPQVTQDRQHQPADPAGRLHRGARREGHLLPATPGQSLPLQPASCGLASVASVATSCLCCACCF